MMHIMYAHILILGKYIGVYKAYKMVGSYTSSDTLSFS